MTVASGHTCFLPRCLRRVRGSRICSAAEANCQKSPVGMADWTAKSSAFESLQSGPPPYVEGPAIFSTQKQSWGSSLFTWYLYVGSCVLVFGVLTTTTPKHSSWRIHRHIIGFTVHLHAEFCGMHAWLCSVTGSSSCSLRGGISLRASVAIS